MWKSRYTKNKKAYLSLNKKAKVKAIINEKDPLTKTQRKQVKELVADPVEHKHFTANQAYAVIDYTSPVNFLLTNIPQQTVSATDQVRLGDQVKIDSISIKLSVQNGINLAASQPAIVWRVLLVQDKNYNSTGTLTLAQVFNNDPNAGIPSTLSHRNRDHLGTKIILYDRTFTTGIYWNNGHTLTIKPKLKYMKHKIQYDAGSTTAMEGGVYLLIFNDNAQVNDPYYSFQTRIVYSDA